MQPKTKPTPAKAPSKRGELSANRMARIEQNARSGRRDAPIVIPAEHVTRVVRDDFRDLGAIALLALADVTNDDGCERYLARFYRHGEDPTPEQLRAAVDVLRWIECAIMAGSAHHWLAIERARAELRFSPKVLAVGFLRDYVSYRNLLHGVTRETGKEKRAVATLLQRRRVEARDRSAQDTIAKLAWIDSRFCAVQATQFVDVLEGVEVAAPRRGRGQKSVFHALAELALDVGAWDVTLASQERAIAITRIANAIGSEVIQAPKHPLRKR